MRLVLVLFLALLLQACTTGHCRHLRDEENAKNAAEGKPMPKADAPSVNLKPSSADRMRVYKFDGSLQCNMGKSRSLSEMQKDLKSIEVFQSWKRHDGMMRVQLCGSPTGQSNVYEIDRKDLEAALKLGFKEWTVD